MPGFGDATFGDETFADDGGVYIPPDLPAELYNLEDVRMAIVSDLIDEAQIVNNGNGFTCVRVFLVDGVTGDADQRLYAASLAAGVPAYGDPHRFIPNTFVDSITGKPASAGSNTTFRITVTYKTPDPASGNNGGGGNKSGQARAFPVVRVGSSLSQVVVNEGVPLDVPGGKKALMEVGNVTIEQAADLNNIPDPKVAELQKLIPQTVISISRKEKFDPTELSINFTGRINKEAWRGLGAGKVLCTRIEGQSSDGGITFDTTYEFQYNAQSWDQDVYYIDPVTNRPLSQNEVDEAQKAAAQIGNTAYKPIRTFRIYDEVSFSGLHLDLDSLRASPSTFAYGIR